MFALGVVYRYNAGMINTESIKSKFAKPEALSSIAESAGQVFLGGMLVGPFISNSNDWQVMSAGLVLSVSSWLTSVYLSKN